MLNKKNVAINYTARDYQSIKNEMVEFAKRYYADTYKDFSDAGFGSMLIDLESYISDQLSYYLDYQANETFLDSMIEYNNVIRKGREYGYKYPGAISSQGVATLYIIVPSNATGYGPNLAYAPVVKKGTQVITDSNISFILNEDADFSKSENEVVVATVDDDTGVPTSYAIKTYGKVISGMIGQETINVFDFKKFRKLSLEAEDIVEILSVQDAEGHDYYEVEYLSQNIVYRPIANTDTSTNTLAPSILRAYVNPRRFIVEKTRRNTALVFGHGSETETTNQSVVDPSNVVLNLYGKTYSTDASFDPARLLETDKFGIAPANTTITVTYRVNSAGYVNVPVASIRKIVGLKYYFADQASLLGATMQSVLSSLEVSNEEPIIGDVNLPTSDELKMRVYDAYAAQNRAVTARDYMVACYMMPEKYGAIKRAAVMRDSDSFKRNLNLYIVCEDPNGRLTTANAQIKDNLKNWLLQHKMVNDTIDILDAGIINVGISYEVMSDGTKDKTELINDCNVALAEKFSIAKNIGEHFFVSDIESVLMNIKGVVMVTKAEVVKRIGDSYSGLSIDIDSNLSANDRVLVCPENCIFEIKYPELDITGAVKTWL